MTAKTKEKEVLQWHSAFYAGIQIELEEEEELLIYENEHQLGTKPMEIDVLIIKKQNNVQIRKNIGRLFRTHNIIEYKSPDDYLSIDDFYKVYGYACFYKSDVRKVNMISAQEITITFVCNYYPKKMIRHLEKIRHIKVIPFDEGIFYLVGDAFPMQVIVTSQLSRESNFWLKSLTNDLREKNEAEELVIRYGKHQNENRYSSVMDIIVKANKELFEEVNGMCDALMEIVQDKMNARIQEEVDKQVKEQVDKQVKEQVDKQVREQVKELVRKKVAKGKTIEEIADALEESIDVITELMNEL